MAPRLLTLLLLVSLAQVARAQQPATVLPPVDSAKVVSLRLTDGSEMVGRVVAATDSSVLLLTPAGLRVNVPRGSLVSWRVRAGTIVGAEFRRSDPNVSRLFFAPTGRTLHAGDGYFSDYYLFFPMVAAGLSDRVTLAGGMSLFPGVSLDQQLFYVAPKIGLVQTPSFAVSAGALYVKWRVSDFKVSGGVAYGVATFGGEDQAATVGVGWPFANGETTASPWLMLGAEQRIGGGTKFLVEVWKFPGANDMPGIFGLRFFGERIAVDFGFVHLFGADVGNFPFIPWLDFVVNW